MTDKLLAFTTAGSQTEADKIAQTLVEQRLAACVNIVPRVQSVYRWQGKVERAEEFLLIIKTSRSLEEQVRSAIGEAHSYELPEFIVVPIESGSPEYLKWLSESVKSDKRR